MTQREHVAKVRRIAELLVDALAELEESLPQVEPDPVRPGRPWVIPSEAQQREVLRLAHSNGRLGLREIGRRVDLSWRVVERILASHNSPPASHKSSVKRSGKARSNG